METGFKKGHYYKIKLNGFTNGTYIAEYMGCQQGWNCMICGKGHNAKTFNIFGYKNDTLEEAFSKYRDGQYETWGFGNEHLPTLLEEVKEVIK